MSERAARIMVIENMTLRCWLSCALPVLFGRGKTDSPISSIYYVDASARAVRVAGIVAKLIGVQLQRLDFRLVDIRDEEGLLMRLRIAYRDLASVQAAAMKDPVFVEFVTKAKPADRLMHYIVKNIATISLSDRGTLWRALQIVQVCKWRNRRSGAVTRPLLLLESRPWFRAIKEYATAQGVDVIPSSATVDPGKTVRDFVGPKGVALVREVRNRVLHRRFVPRLKTSTVPTLNTPKIAVEYQGNLQLERPERYSDLFFWQRSTLSGGDILVMFGVPQDPCDNRKWSELKKHGIGAVAMYPGAAMVPEVPFFRYRPSLQRRTPIDYNPDIRRTWEARWLLNQVEGFSAQRDYWTSFFESQNVRVFVTWYRFDSKHCVISDALETVDGVSVIYQRAFQPDASAEITVDADVMFGYSPVDAEVEKLSGSRIPYHVAVGYFGDHRIPLLREKALEVRNLLRRNGAQFILAYFDENSAEDSRWHTGHEFMRVNFAFLLEKVISHDWLGLVIKPKRPGNLRRRLGEVAELLERALATGRCFSYEGGQLHGVTSAAEAALAADVAIHGHLCAGTAGLEAALAGVPTLLLDREGWSRSPLYRLGVGRVVFKDWQTLWDAIVVGRDDPHAIAGFGDWSPIINEIDPFRDGRAAERMGTYLKWILDGLKAGVSRDTILADAAERYCKLWGPDKINSVGIRHSTGLSELTLIS